jgi:acetyl esterase/lipase
VNRVFDDFLGTGRRATMRMRARVVLAVLILTAWVGPAPSADGPKIATINDIVYSRPGPAEMKLDVAYPTEGTGPFPGVVVLYGGAWRVGNKWGNRGLLAEFARRGYVAVAPQYRHCPKDIFPAQVHDVKAAVRWLRGHATEYRVDVDHIGAMGFSAGAHLSLMLGVTGPDDGLEGDVPPDSPSSKVQAVVNYFGPSDLTHTDVSNLAAGLVRDFLGARPVDRPDLAAKASPITFLSKDDAAILTFHGTKDPLVPFNQSTKLADAMSRVGLPGRVELLVGAGHGWTGPEMKRTMNDTYEFFDEHLRPRPKMNDGQ